MNPYYKKLFDQSLRIHHLEGISSLLDWDQETYMPQGAANVRGDQCQTLAGIIHEEKISRKFTAPLSNLIDLKTGKILVKNLSKRQQSAVREWRRDYLIETALPKKFVEDFAKLTSQSVGVWRHAREQNQFQAFAPSLKKIVEANRKKADYIGYQDHPYDALLDLYEPGMTVKTITPIFDKLKKEIVALLKRIAQAPQVDEKCLSGNYPVEKQLLLSKQILEAMGVDFAHARLDLSTHPFCSSTHQTDTRLTTRIHPKNVFSCISTVMHEGGHALYGMGLPLEEYGTPLGSAISMGIHESQSRFWETRIGLSEPFIKFLLPLVKKTFPKTLPEVDTIKYYKAINKVEPSLIRVEADEVTYPLHVILRFELEIALIEGSLAIKDLPAAWNEKMKSYLGITPPTDTLGCLQDVHWSIGALGYFPTYALGNLYAAQFFAQFTQEFPDWEKRVSQGKFLFIREFLQQHVFRYGREFRSAELIQKSTGKAFSADDYVKYLQKKYSKIYSLP